jgi:ATP-dependent helicase/DNAse subunit B
VVLSQKPLSATQLENYARCPAQYYFSNRLKLRPQLAGDSAYALRFGQATHLALENFFKHPVSVTPEEMPHLLNYEFEKALTEIAPGLVKTGASHVILTENFRKLAQKVPRLEARLRELFAASTPIAIERGFRIPVEGFEVTGKIDRVDRVSNGAVLVLDYKTGSVDFSPNHMSNGSNFQALLYLIAAGRDFSEPMAGILFYDLKKGELRRGVVKEEFLSAPAKKLLTRGHALNEAAYQMLLQEGLKHLTNLANQIAAGEFAPTPTPAVCDYCEYPVYCRKAYQHG